ncbi:MAG: putative lipoprotein, partial [Gammaproteobacteria bacterium]|nr:putative lipoprotein [Gammaproteobacteria bacterium]
IHAGESQGTLKGSRLDEVASLTVKNVTFVPGELSTRAGSDELPMVAQDAQAAAALKAEHVAARVTLQDGRSLPVAAIIDTPRPRVSLIGKSVQASVLAEENNIQLTDPGELPQDALLIFSVRAQSPATFARDEGIDVATGDESFATTLNLANGGLTLENAQVAVATLNPAKAFGSSTFGPLKFRVNVKGVTSDWQPLANLVRLPVLKELKCPVTPELACKLIGTNLFLVDSVAGDPEFTHPVTVPDGYLGSALPVPHPTTGPLYIKLRDNPQVVNPTLLTVQQLPPPPPDDGRAEARHSALRSDNQGPTGTPAAAAPAP